MDCFSTFLLDRLQRNEFADSPDARLLLEFLLSGRTDPAFIRLALWEIVHWPFVFLGKIGTARMGQQDLKDRRP